MCLKLTHNLNEADISSTLLGTAQGVWFWHARTNMTFPRRADRSRGLATLSSLGNRDRSATTNLLVVRLECVVVFGDSSMKDPLHITPTIPGLRIDGCRFLSRPAQYQRPPGQMTKPFQSCRLPRSCILPQRHHSSPYCPLSAAPTHSQTVMTRAPPAPVTESLTLCGVRGVSGQLQSNCRVNAPMVLRRATALRS